MAQASTLSQAFLALVRERRGEALEAWITETTASGIEALTRLAQGLREDLAAVTAGLTLPWSNGPVEGHVNRLKLLKRQGYGRAGCALLRHRVLPQPSQARGHKPRQPPRRRACPHEDSRGRTSEHS
jgi:transposase